GTMRTFLLGLLVGSLLVSALAARPQASQKETIWVGTDLTLGMSEDTAIKQLAESRHTVRKISVVKALADRGITSIWVVDEQGEKGRSLGTILFASGKLESVVKFLLPDNGNEVDFGRQLYFEMRNLELEGDSRCVIETTNGKTPQPPKTTLLPYSAHNR